jgi:hypothetical protein
MKVAVYLVCATLRDRSDVEYTFRERRLVRQNPTDKVLATIDAPRGTRIRRRPDHQGAEQLLIPIRTSFWSWLFRRRQVVPAKYVIDNARRGQYGLSLVSWDLALGEEKPSESLEPTRG